MLQVVSCENCGSPSLGFDSIHVNVVLSKTVQPCSHCNQTRTETQSFMFCCLPCFHAYNAKVAAGEAEYKWKTYQDFITPV